MILANSLFTARVFKSYFSSIKQLPSVVYPGINLAAYEPLPDSKGAENFAVASYATFLTFRLTLTYIVA